jgi:FGGY-family pentulose kinase
MGPLVAAVDVGSGTARAGLFNVHGHLIRRAEAAFATGHPITDHAEHSSEDIWRAVCRAVRQALAESGASPQDVKGLAFDATCSLVMLDRSGAAVTVSTTRDDYWNVVMWADHRATAEAGEMTATRHRVLDHVGGVMSPEMELPKLLWLKRHLREAWQRYGMALDLTDFLTWKATGAVAVSACTVTCKWTYLNHEEPGWQQDFLVQIGLADLQQKLALPSAATPIGTDAGALTAEAAAQLGLSRACIIGVGAIDAHAGGIGVLGGLAGREFDNHLAMIAGTSTCHMAVSPNPRLIPGVWGPYFGAMLPGLWLNEAGQSATGALLDHILDWHSEGRNLGPDRHAVMAARIAAALAAEGSAFAGDLHVLPDFHGNRSPLADPESVGVIHGLRLDASPRSLDQLYYTMAIGVALGTRHIVDALNQSGYRISHLHLTGGHAASPFLVQLYADAGNLTVVLPEQSEGVLLGTACVAAAACALHGSISDAAASMVRDGRTFHPNPASREFFNHRYRAFLLMHAQRAALTCLQ